MCTDESNVQQAYDFMCFLEVRMQERVFMGIGNKPFMDIQPSDAAISDRAVNYVLIGRGNTALLIALLPVFVIILAL